MSIKVEYFLLSPKSFLFTINYMHGGNAMEDRFTGKGVLHQLGIGKSYSGYDYILHAINLIEQNERVLSGITKILYIDIAREFNTSDSCVERNIRKVIEVIWKTPETNKTLILEIFGSKYEVYKPSNKEFLELLYEYIKSHNLLYDILHAEKVICPVSNRV